MPGLAPVLDGEVVHSHPGGAPRRGREELRLTFQPVQSLSDVEDASVEVDVPPRKTEDLPTAQT